MNLAFQVLGLDSSFYLGALGGVRPASRMSLRHSSLSARSLSSANLFAFHTLLILQSRGLLPEFLTVHLETSALAQELYPSCKIVNHGT